jgi:hypothetical protein
MSSIPICSYCDAPCSKRAHYFRVERIENGRVTELGFACGCGCLMAVASVQRDGERAIYQVLRAADASP